MSLSEILRDYAGFGPGIVIALAVSVAMAGSVGRRLGTSRLIGGGLVFSLGLVLAATVTPSRAALVFGIEGSGTCDVTRLGLASLSALRHLDERGLNVLLFVPLGIALGLLPGSRAKWAMVAGALLLPFGIELIQLVVVALGRQCQTADVVDNLTGLAIGLIVGSVGAWIWSRRMKLT